MQNFRELKGPILVGLKGLPCLLLALSFFKNPTLLRTIHVKLHKHEPLKFCMPTHSSDEFLRKTH